MNKMISLLLKTNEKSQIKTDLLQPRHSLNAKRNNMCVHSNSKRFAL